METQRSADGKRTGFSRVWLAVGLGSLVLFVAVTSVVALNLKDSEPSDSVEQSSEASNVVQASDVQVNPGDLATSSVKIVPLGLEDNPSCSGSGTIVTPSGHILTSANVVTSSEECDFTALGVSVLVTEGAAPILAYRAELLSTDAALDIAVIRIVKNISDGSDLEGQFSPPTLGNSDVVAEGTQVLLAGYAAGGGSLKEVETTVKGLAEHSGLPETNIFQTDSQTVQGFSGATVVDLSGQVVGLVGSSTSDCVGKLPDPGQSNRSRNSRAECFEGDGPVNVVRPINQALPILDEVSGADPISVSASTPLGDLSGLAFRNPRFSTDQLNNEPQGITKNPTVGTNKLCLFVDWEGMPEGAVWDAIWYQDGKPRLDYSLRSEVWNKGAAGSNFWVCAVDNEGLEPGIYELGFFISGENVFAEGIELTETARPQHQVTWVNVTEVQKDICSLAINPKGSGPVGLNEMEPGQVIKPGESITLTLPEGVIVAAADDCEGNRLAVDLAGLTVDAPKEYKVGIPAE